MITRRLAAAALLLVTAGCTGTTPEPTPEPEPTAGVTAAPRWHACDDTAVDLVGERRAAEFRFACADVRVPRNWARAADGTFTVAVIRARAKNQVHRLGSLLVNPGGPGASGFDFGVYAATGVLPAEVTRRFDVVGFDPRGVGRSSPVHCIPDRTKDQLTAADPDPATQAEFDAQVTRWRDVGAGCARRHGDALGLYSTEQTARDMDRLRAVTGDAETTYLGYSYGSLLGAVHAHLYPGKLRAMVLDGAIDPRASAVEASERQAAGFERAFRDFAADCRRRGTACPAGPDATRTLRRVLSEVSARPLPAPDGRTVTAGHVLTGVVAGLYAEGRWPDLARALADADRGNGQRILQLSDDYTQRREDGTYTNLLDANTAINCADEADPPSATRVRALQLRWRTEYPLFGAALATSLIACSVWPAAPDPYPTGAARGAPPILVVGTSGDPATPYGNTPRLARLLGTGVVLRWDGEGHTAYPRTRCVTGAVDRYLLTTDPPPDGRTCPA